MELFEDTDTTLRIEFHSCRRAFVTALARANVNVPTAQLRSGYADAKGHQRYVAALLTA